MYSACRRHLPSSSPRDVQDIPCGNSVISSGAIWPRRSRVACTLDWKPLANLLADWPMLRPARPDESLLQPSMSVERGLWWQEERRYSGTLCRCARLATALAWKVAMAVPGVRPDARPQTRSQPRRVSILRLIPPSPPHPCCLLHRSVRHGGSICLLWSWL